MHRQPFNYQDLVQALKTTRGWHSTISRETGVPRAVLRRIANQDGYEPRVNNFERLVAWFEEHGVPDRHPAALRAQERREREAVLGAAHG